MDYSLAFWVAIAVVLVVAVSFYRILLTRIASLQAQIDHARSDDSIRHIDALKSIADSTSVLRKALDVVGQRFDQIRQDTIDTNRRLDEHSHPHNHDGVPEHVHWFRYNSTELTNGIRRDVYECMVPGCNKIAAHTPD